MTWKKVLNRCRHLGSEHKSKPWNKLVGFCKSYNHFCLCQKSIWICAWRCKLSFWRCSFPSSDVFRRHKHKSKPNFLVIVWTNLTLGVDSPVCAESGVSADLPVEGVSSGLSGCQVRPEKPGLNHKRQNRCQNKAINIICSNFLKLKVSMKACGAKH